MNATQAKRFSLSQISRATGVSLGRLQMWLSRGYIKYVAADGDRDNGTGVRHQISTRTALRVAIMDAVSPFVDASQAGPAISKFMDTGTPASPGCRYERKPGGLFESGETVLCVFVDGTADVLCIHADTVAASIPCLKRGQRAAIVPMNDLYQRLFRHLAIGVKDQPPHSLLENGAGE